MELEYPELTITVWTLVSRACLYPIDYAHPDEYDDNEIEISWTYDVDDNYVTEFLYNFLANVDDFQDYSADDLSKYIEDNFEVLCDKYIDEIRDYFEDQARENAEENYVQESPEPDYDDYY